MNLSYFERISMNSCTEMNFFVLKTINIIIITYGIYGCLCVSIMLVPPCLIPHFFILLILCFYLLINVTARYHYQFDRLVNSIC